MTPTEGTSPMPSIDIDVASLVCQVNCTWSPAETRVGVAVICAVGAGAVAAATGAVAGGGRGFYFAQPDTATRATRRATDARMRFCRVRFCRVNGFLLPQGEEFRHRDSCRVQCRCLPSRSRSFRGEKDRKKVHEPVGWRATDEAGILSENIVVGARPIPWPSTGWGPGVSFRRNPSEQAP